MWRCEITEKNDRYYCFLEMGAFYDTLYGDVRKRQKMVGIGIVDKSAEFLGRDAG